MPSGWMWAILLAAGVFLRFFHLVEFHPWLNGDEALEGYFGMDLVKKWSWQFFYQTGQLPPLYIWITSLLFRVSGDPFFNTWFTAAFFSSLALLVSYPAARFFLGRDISILFSLLFAFSFWPLMYGRWGIQSTLVPFFVLVCFWLLGAYFKAGDGSWKTCLSAAVGLWLGLGSLTYTSWLIVIPSFFLLMFLDLSEEPRKRIATFSFFSGALLLGFSPWMIAAVREKFGGYMVGVSMASGFFTWRQQIAVAFSSLTTLFWGPLGTSAVYGPTWGGLLNPFLGACFFLGVIKAGASPRSHRATAAALLLLLFVAPSVFSADNVEAFRMIQALPLLLAGSAVGLKSLLGTLSASRRPAVLGLLLFVSLGVDLYHLWRPHLEGTAFHWKVNHDSGDENQQAYEALKPVSQRMGPGLVFTEFLLLSHNHSLRVAAYPFNALDNPQLPVSQAAWAGVVTNIHYGFFLARRFPGSEWRRLSWSDTEDGGEVVGILRITDKNRDIFQKWAKAEAYLHQLGVESEGMINDPQNYARVVEKLPGGYPYAQGDPFLESIFSEWFAQYHFGGGLNRNIQFLENGISKGYPAANLYYKLGNFYYWNREPEKARQAYLMAVKCRPNYTDAAEVLSRLWGGK